MVRQTRRSAVAVVLSVMLVCTSAAAAFARPTVDQFASMMRTALLAKAATYHLNKSQVTAAFKEPALKSNLYTAGALICQKLATETPKQAATDLVTLTKQLGAMASASPTPSPSASATPTPKLTPAIFKGVVGVGLTVTTAKNSLCPKWRTKANQTLVIFNKSVGAKSK